MPTRFVSSVWEYGRHSVAWRRASLCSSQRTSSSRGSMNRRSADDSLRSLRIEDSFSDLQNLVQLLATADGRTQLEQAVPGDRRSPLARHDAISTSCWTSWSMSWD